MSCFLSSVTYASELGINEKPSPELNLELPTPLKVKSKSGEMYLGFTAEQYKKVLNIYVMYDFLGDEYLYNQAEIRLLGLRLEVNIERLALKDELIDILKKDREFVHETWQLDREDARKEAKRQKIQIVLFTTGGIAVGFILGLIGSVFM